MFNYKPNIRIGFKNFGYSYLNAHGATNTGSTIYWSVTAIAELVIGVDSDVWPCVCACSIWVYL